MKTYIQVSPSRVGNAPILVVLTLTNLIRETFIYQHICDHVTLFQTGLLARLIGASPITIQRARDCFLLSELLFNARSTHPEIYKLVNNLNDISF